MTHSVQSTEFAPIMLVNQAGSWLLSCHPWKFLERPPYRLSLRGQIAISAATWTEATKTLTVTNPASAFASYTFLEGDEVQIVSGTGATAGYYTIVSNTTSALVLATSIGSAANGQTNITGTVSLASIILPSDIQELIAIQADGLTNKQVQLCDFQALVNMKASGLTGSSWGYWAAIDWGGEAATHGGAPTPRLEIYPTPSSNQTAALAIFYRAGWVKLTDDADISNTPEWFDPLLIQAVRAYSRGIEEDDQASMSHRLGEVRSSLMFQDIARRDGAIQRKYQKIRGSAVRRSPWPANPHYQTLSITPP